MKEIKTVLVPIDFSSNTEKVMDTARAMAEKFGATLHLLHISESLAPYSGFVIPHISTDVLAEEIREQAEKKMQNCLETEQRKGGNWVGKVIPGDDVADEVVDYSTRNKAGLIIMGTHGYKGIEKTFMGSVAEKVLRLASCPVMVVKPD